MGDSRREGDVDAESVALAFQDDVHGWATAEEALHAFLDSHTVTADGVLSPDGVPNGQPSLEHAWEGECTWTISSEGEVAGSVTAVRLTNGWVIQYFSRRV